MVRWARLPQEVLIVLRLQAGLKVPGPEDGDVLCGKQLALSYIPGGEDTSAGEGAELGFHGVGYLLTGAKGVLYLPHPLDHGPELGGFDGEGVIRPR